MGSSIPLKNMKKIIVTIIAGLTGFAFAKEEIAVPKMADTSCRVTVSKTNADKTTESVQISYPVDGSAPVIVYALNDANGAYKSYGTKKMEGKPRELIEASIGDLFKKGGVVLSEIVAMKEPLTEEFKITVNKMKVGSWTTSFSKKSSDAWNQGEQFLKSVSKISEP